MKTAIIGLGRMGLRHLENLQSLKLELVGLCDAFPQARKDVQEKTGIAEVCFFPDPQVLLEKAQPDCLIIATTAPAHCELVCSAAKAGVSAILCEKPMAVSLTQCRLMIEACKKSGTHLAINHQMRFMEQYNQPKDMLDSEDFGGLTSVSITAGNFGLAMNGTHYFEMFRYLTDEPVLEVQAWFSDAKVPNPRGPQFDDRAGTVRMTTASGKRFYLDASADQGHGVCVLYAARNGQITIDELGGRMSWAVRKPEHRDMPTTRYGMPWEEGSAAITPADALQPSLCVLKALLKKQNYPSGEDGLLALKALVAAYVSNAQGHRSVRLDEQLPEDQIFPWA